VRALQCALLAGAASCLPAAASAAPAAPQAHWIATWAAVMQPAPGPVAQHFERQTLRLIVHTSAGGSQVRVRIANTYGDTPLVIGESHVARALAGASIAPGTDRALRFGGRRSVTIAPHATVVSDPVALDVPALADLAVSLYLPGPTAARTWHLLALQTSYVSAPGNATAAAQLPGAKAIESWPFLAGVDVAAPPQARTVVAFGDSTVDGDGSTEHANHRWPDRLAARLNGTPGRLPVGVVNEGVIGVRLLRDAPAQAPIGPSGLARFERDALSQPGAGVVIVKLGINDLGQPGSAVPAAELPTAEALEAGFRDLAVRAHARGLRVIGSTLSPFEDTPDVPGFYTPEKEALRVAVNDWLRRTPVFDAVLDADQLLRDPQHPARLLPAYDSGDHLHPNDAGYQAIADALTPQMLGLPPAKP
jgi:lysophospholipase L1-like esterase